MPNVTFRFEDGTATVVAVTSGENLLEVARKAISRIRTSRKDGGFPALVPSLVMWK